jgi:tetratricopeptide (TPR) repeat protein
MFSRIFQNKGFIIFLFVLAFVLFSFLPRTKKSNQELSGNKGSDLNIIESFISEFVDEIPKNVKQGYQKFKSKSLSEKINFWYAQKNEFGVAYEWSVFASDNKSDTSWSNAAKWFLRAAMVQNNPEIKMQCYRLSLDAFNRAFTINPNNKKHLMDKATVLVESGINPMEGIGLLRKMEESDSANVELLIRLGRFSIQSGQYEKAILRLNKAIQLDSLRLDAHLYIADAYREMNNIPNSLKHLKYFAAKTKNEEEKLAAQEFIAELEKK